MRIGDVSTGIPTVDTRLFEEAWRNAAASLARFWEDADPMISSPEFQATLSLEEEMARPDLKLPFFAIPDPTQLRVCAVGADVEMLLRDLGRQLLELRCRRGGDHDLLRLAAKSLAHVVEHRREFRLAENRFTSVASADPLKVQLKFDRYTDRARKALQLANQAAQVRNHDYLGVEHMLVGILEAAGDPELDDETDVLIRAGIDRDALLRQAWELVAPSNDQMIAMGSLPYTPRAKLAVQGAADESKLLGDQFIGCQHLLLALATQGDGNASEAFRLCTGLSCYERRGKLLAAFPCRPLRPVARDRDAEEALEGSRRAGAAHAERVNQAFLENAFGGEKTRPPVSAAPESKNEPAAEPDPVMEFFKHSAHDR